MGQQLPIEPPDEESQPLGTGGALRLAASLVRTPDALVLPGEVARGTHAFRSAAPFIDIGEPGDYRAAHDGMVALMAGAGR